MVNFHVTTTGVILVLVVALVDLGSTTAELSTLVAALGMILFGTMISFQ